LKVAVIRFPGSNCDQDALHSLRDDMGIATEYVWHDDSSLAGFDAVFVPGGFSYGDYLRCGAMASRAPIMAEVRRFAKEGRPIIGVCNGFQILCEADLLPGALLLNESQKFVCKYIHLAAVNRTSPWTAGVKGLLELPVAHGEGRFIAEPDVLKELQDKDRIAFRYVGPNGEGDGAFNPNGSMDDVAGIVNEKGNVLGMMPHPERATKALLGPIDGRQILAGFRALASV
jgi:phosphoribosylformylglycinamidine synthase subunit PurQ / glutaminase